MTNCTPATAFINVSVEPEPDESLSVQVIADPATVLSGKNSVVTVHVEHGGMAVTSANVTITLSPDIGIFTCATGLTGPDGNYTTTYTAPVVNKTTNTKVEVRVTKSNMAESHGKLNITILPDDDEGRHGGKDTFLPLTIGFIVAASVAVALTVGALAVRKRRKGGEEEE